jgi:methyl-accepting chemotaxis protein
MNITVRKKIIGSFVIVLVMLVVVASAGIIQLYSVNDTYQSFLKDEVGQKLEVKNLQEQMIRKSAAVRSFLLTGEADYLTEYDEAVKNFDNSMKKLKTTITDKELLNTLTALDEMSNNDSKFAQDQIQMKKDNDELGYLILAKSTAQTLGMQFNAKVSELLSIQEKHLDHASSLTTNKIDRIVTIMIVISVAAILVALALATIISLQIAKPIVHASKAIEKVASGDLSIEEIQVKNKDEIGAMIHSVNLMVSGLREVVVQVRDSSAQVAASSEQLSTSAQDSTQASEQISHIVEQNSEGMDLQLQHLTKIHALIEEMSTNISLITKSSEKMLVTADNTFQVTDQGALSIEKVVNQMNLINDGVINTSQIIRQLGKRSNEITSILNMITTIADQTNLLALNAAIEAARAGEHGKGFAVVADEVRKLAEESKKSADQITKMISYIQTETELAVSAMEEQSHKVSDGFEYSQDAKRAFTLIGESMGDVIEKVSDVSCAIELLNMNNTNVVQAIGEVKGIAEASVATTREVAAGTEENVATLQEVTASAQDLSGMAETLQQLVSRFKI